MSSTPPQLQTHVLVVDDEPDLRVLYQLTLLREGYQVEAAANLAEAQQFLAQNQFDAVITDMRLPDGLGLELLYSMGAQQRSERCIVMTAYGSAENAVEALRAGAFDYLTKPVDLKQFRAVVASAIKGHGMAHKLTKTKDATLARGDPRTQSADTPRQLASAEAALARLAGDSVAMRNLKERVAKVARSMAPVLIHGESGTGKELVARAVHACSHRTEAAFIAVNCGAIPENLLEAEFFGSKKGAYTGAAQDREGYFQAARGGTLFLDEIGDLPLGMQSKLLRAIQERRVRSLGSTQEDSVDVRIVSASHKDLALETRAGRFRQDLYYRLNVIDIVVPPLRERRSDLPAICNALLARIAQESGLSAPVLAPEALASLANLPLQGNVRELENLLHRAMALNDGGLLQLDLVQSHAQTPKRPSASSGEMTADFTTGAADPTDLPQDLQAYLDQEERKILVQALHETQFNRTAAAAQLGLSLRQIRYRIARLNIATPHSDEASDEPTA